jgi:hypothetical protein
MESKSLFLKWIPHGERKIFRYWTHPRFSFKVLETHFKNTNQSDRGKENFYISFLSFPSFNYCLCEMRPLTYSRGRFRQKQAKFSSRTILPRNVPHSPFSEKYVSGLNFFTKPPLLLFSGPNGLCGSFQGKNITNEEFGHFCLKRPQNRFSEKHVFGPNFFTKPPCTYFCDQTNYVARFEAKLSRTKTSLAFA